MIQLPTGWLSDVEVEALQRLARDQLVLEIGSYLGRSTVALAKVAKHVVSIDHHRGSPEFQRGQPTHDPKLINSFTDEFDSLPSFLNNLSQYGVRELVSVMVGSSGDIGPLLADQIFDVVFVDGHHSIESVMADARLAFRVVKPAGVVVFHDYEGDSVKLGIQAVRPVKPEVVVAQTLAVYNA